MSKDYKHNTSKSHSNKRSQKTHASQQSGPPSTFGTFIFGGLVGGLTTFIILYLTPAPECPTIAASTQAECPVVQNTRIPEPLKPKYDFYHLLPQLEVVVPQTQQAIERERVIQQQPDVKTTYILQAGSFRSGPDADSLKARLAIMGIEATVQQVAITEDNVWHRVRIGPFDQLRKLEQTQHKLERNGIKPMMIRVGR